MTFDVDKYRAAHPPWSFTIGGKTFDAQYVSAVDCTRFERKLAAGQGDSPRQLRACWWILRRAFPWRVDYWVRGDPVRIIFALRPKGRAEALVNFYACAYGVGKHRYASKAPIPTKDAVKRRRTAS